MSDLSELQLRTEAETMRLSKAMRDADGRHRAAPLFVLLALLAGLACAAMFGRLLPTLFGASDNVIGGATIIGVSIVLTGVLVAVAAALFLRIQSVSVIAAQAEEAKRQIGRGREDARAIVALRAKMSVRSHT